MAEFCKQCADDHDFSCDFVGVTTPEDWENGLAAVVLCEGCGAIQVDPQGRCVCDCLLHHWTKPWSELPKENKT